MSRLPTSKMNEEQKRGRRNKHRGYTTEKQLEKFLNDNRISAERVYMSGALRRAGFGDKAQGDVNIKCGEHLIRVEVKSRKKLPRYVTNLFVNRKTHQTEKKPPEERVVKIHGLCAILDQEQFLKYIHTGDLPEIGIEIFGEECKSLREWFKQDDSQIVAMKEFGKRTWYFAVHEKSINKIGGKF